MHLKSETFTIYACTGMEFENISTMLRGHQIYQENRRERPRKFNHILVNDFQPLPSNN